MSDRTYQLAVTVPAGTPLVAPAVTPWPTEDNILDWIEVEIPPGPAGFMGFRVMKGDVQLLPYGTQQWLIADNFTRVFPLGFYMPTGGVTVQAYNTGNYNHTFWLRLGISTRNIPSSAGTATESQVTGLPSGTISSDPLSADSILGPDTVNQLAAGTVTADDIAPPPGGGAVSSQVPS